MAALLSALILSPDDRWGSPRRFRSEGRRMAREKCQGQDPTLPWGWWLGSDVAIHGLLITRLSGVSRLGLAE